jgi:hypothetical protein
MAFGLALGVAGTGVAFASYARIESMGKNSTYVMDDVSIFDNPANINIYPNFLIGEFGPYQNNNLGTGNNQDPLQPWFGGIFSLALGQEDSRDPRLSIAGAFNRRDEKLFSYLPDSVRVPDSNNPNIMTTVPVPNPVTNFDGFLGGTLPNGNAGGLHIYIAQQQGGVENATGFTINKDAFASIFKVDAGINIQLNTDIDAEISAGIARIQYGPEQRDLIDGDLMSVMGSARLFSTWSLINGELVPAASWSYVKAPGIDDKQLIGGIGVNVALDRGFFWLGTDFMYGLTRMDNFQINASTGDKVFVDDGSTGSASWDVKESWGGRISFGIERNIWFDWLVIRVGGMKVINYVDCTHNDGNAIPATLQNKYETLCPEDGNYFYSNPSGDGSINDNIGFGFGINVEEKLKVDFTMAEDVIFRNPFQGEGRLMSRISATYSF